MKGNDNNVNFFMVFKDFDTLSKKEYEMSDILQ